MNKINIINNIPRWDYTIGMLPTSFLESMTYQEQLLWLCNYFTKTVAPSINEVIINFNEMFDSFTNLSEDFTELDETVSNALVELNHNLEVGLNAIETSLSNELPTLAENVISEKIQAGELNCQLGTSYNSEDEELTFTIQVISGE